MYPYRSIFRIRLNWADETKTESSGPTSTASGCPSRASTASPPPPVSPPRPPPPRDPNARGAPGELPAPQGTVEPRVDGGRDVGGEHPDQDPVLRRFRVCRAGGRSVRTGGRRAGGGPFLRIREPHPGRARGRPPCGGKGDPPGERRVVGGEPPGGQRAGRESAPPPRETEG